VLSQLISHHSYREKKRKAFKNLKPGQSYDQAKKFYRLHPRKNMNSLEVETQKVNNNNIAYHNAIKESLKWGRDLIRSKSPASSRLRRSHDKLLSKKEQYHRSLRSLSNGSRVSVHHSQKYVSIKQSQRSVKFSAPSSRLSSTSLPRHDTKGCHHAYRKSQQSRISTKSQQSVKSKASSKSEYYKSQRQKLNDFTFAN
jgi:hypothetical protein